MATGMESKGIACYNFNDEELTISDQVQQKEEYMAKLVSLFHLVVWPAPLGAQCPAAPVPAPPRPPSSPGPALACYL